MTLPSGTTLRHFEITGALGAGGMGEVYRARDKRLGRSVAIKVLPETFTTHESSLVRFDREAKALATVNHPCVAAVYGLEHAGDTPFLVMELVEGETLATRLRRGPLSPDQARGIFGQIAEALEAAHGAGIVHRDLKPANIMVDSEDGVKVLDFGLSKLSTSTHTADDDHRASTLTAPLTQPGAVLGTAAYMSPEQAQGLEVDARSDIWSFGACFFEALTCNRPFAGNNNAQVLASILKDEPRLDDLPASTPPELRTLLRRCLTKDRSNRLQAIGDARLELSEASSGSGDLRPTRQEPRRARRAYLGVLAALLVAVGAIVSWGVLERARPPRQGIDSVVVLPLSDVGENSEDAYLADGISQHLINKLANRGDLKVIARETAFRFRDRNLTPQQLGEELSVASLVTGRIDRREDRILVQIELVDAADGSQLWGDQFAAETGDLIELQRRITRAVLDRLQPEITPHGGSIEMGTDHPEALDLLMRASYRHQMRTRESVNAALADYRKAAEVDPDYAEAYLGIATCHADLRNYGFVGSDSIIDDWRQALDKALALDDSLAQAWKVYGILMYSYYWDWEAAESMFQRALSLDPRSAEIHSSYAYYLANFDPERALESARKGLELDPNGLYQSRAVAVMLDAAGRHEEAIAQARATLEMDSSYYPALMSLYFNTLRSPSPGDAIEIVESITSLTGETPRARMLTAMAQASVGNVAPGARLIEDIEDGSAGLQLDNDKARLLILMGRDSDALDSIEGSLESKEWSVVRLRVDSLFDPVRDQPRFSSFVEQVGIPEL